jgi:hypothetical protein
VAQIRLFHFSDDPSIETFTPQAVAVPSPRPPGQDWLNGPLVWTVDESRQAAYLFPRDCPRILLWLTPRTEQADRDRWWGDRNCSMIAHIEWRWLRRLATTTLYRYELPADSFEPLDDTWMWVSRRPAVPLDVKVVDDLLDALRREEVELRIMENLTPLKDVWATTLHASGIRLRNAQDWPTG